MGSGVIRLGHTGWNVADTARGLVTHGSSVTKSAATGGTFFSVVGLATRSRSGDPMTDFLHRGLVPDAHAPTDWVPDTSVTPGVCDLPRRNITLSAVAFAAQPLVRRAAGTRRARSSRAANRRGHGSARFATLDGMLRVRLDGGFQSSDAFAIVAPNQDPKIAALATLPTLDIAPEAQRLAPVGSLGNPVADPENRHGAAIGIAANALQFDDRPGQLSTAAQAGLWNGAPATAMGVGYTLPNGRLRLDATGVTNVNAWSTVGKTFEVSTVASIPLD